MQQLCITSERVSFTLEGVSAYETGDVCSREGLISELDECLSELAYNTNDGSVVKVESFELKMTEFKSL